MRGPSSLSLVPVLGITERAIRKRLIRLERDGMVTKGAAAGSGYVLTIAGSRLLTTAKKKKGREK